MSDPFNGMTPEEYLNSFGKGDLVAMQARNRELAKRKAEMLADAAHHLAQEDRAPVAKLLGRTHEPEPMWTVLEREVRGLAKATTAYGLRHHSGMWFPQTYRQPGRAHEMRDALTCLWLEGTTTPLVSEFNVARGEHETVEEWKQRQGIGAVWCSKCPNPRHPDPKHHPDGQREHV